MERRPKTEVKKQLECRTFDQYKDTIYDYISKKIKEKEIFLKRIYNEFDNHIDMITLDIEKSREKIEKIIEGFKRTDKKRMSTIFNISENSFDFESLGDSLREIEKIKAEDKLLLLSWIKEIDFALDETAGGIYEDLFFTDSFYLIKDKDYIKNFILEGRDFKYECDGFNEEKNEILEVKSNFNDIKKAIQNGINSAFTFFYDTDVKSVRVAAFSEENNSKYVEYDDDFNDKGSNEDEYVTFGISFLLSKDNSEIVWDEVIDFHNIDESAYKYYKSLIKKSLESRCSIQKINFINRYDEEIFYFKHLYEEDQGQIDFKKVDIVDDFKYRLPQERAEYINKKAKDINNRLLSEIKSEFLSYKESKGF